MTDATEDIRCSFCTKDAHQVRQFIAGPNGIFICDECIEVCVDILRDSVSGAAKPAHEPPSQAAEPRWGTAPGSVRCGLCRMPCSGEDVLLIEGRGILCRPCVSEVERLSTEENWARYPGG